MKKTYTLIALAASMSFAAKIGVLVNEGSCPSGHYPTIITLDAEDSNNATEYSGDDKKPIGITGKKLVNFRYCVFDYDELVRVPYDYVVLKLDEKCPNGAMAFARRHDTEDSDNKNSPKGDFSVWPSVIDDNAKIEYCFVPKISNSNYQYPFQKEYGVFAKYSSGNIAHNAVKIDDEDSKNNNGWDWHDIEDDSIKNRIKKIVEDGKNTVYHTIKWKGDQTLEYVLPPMSLSWKATIGVIKVDDKASCQREFTITLDVENQNNKTEVTAGSSNHPGIDLKGHVDFDYCVIDATNKELSAQYDYVVLKLSRYCPLGTYPFARYHDTENKKNANAPKRLSTVWPSVIDDNARLEYCLVPKKSRGKAYPFSASYGIFADNPELGDNLVYSQIRIDDENDCPNKWQQRMCTDEEIDHGGCDYCHSVGVYGDEWFWYGASSDIQNRIKKIVYGKEDTYFRYIHWNGKTLAKSAEAVVAAPVAAEIAPSAISSIAPEIKGFDHSAITVEVKSAGKIVVSIVNIRGDVVATVSQDNLQPGIHMVKWNSGVIPNGRYIVAVRQNGKVSAKNVILK